MRYLIWVLVILCATVAIGSATVIDNVIEEAKVVGFYRGNTDVLILTNLGYSSGSEVYINEFVEKSGVSFNKNLVFVHNPHYSKLWFAFFNKTTGDCLYIEIDNGRIVKKAVENIKAERLMSNPKEWDKKMKSKVFGGHEFSIITIANLWAKNAPYEFLKCAEFHNHICPGLTSGYMIVKYLERELPLKRGEYYIILAIPPWCKDDCFQVLLDSTVGKRRMYVKAVDKESLKIGNIAGIYIAWNKSIGKGRAVVLAFNWDKACKMAGLNRSDFKKFKTYHWWVARLKMNLFFMDYLDKPEVFVSKVKEFEIDSKTLNEFEKAGVNPYEALGLTKQKSKVKAPFPFETVLIGLGVAYVLKRRLAKP